MIASPSHHRLSTKLIRGLLGWITAGLLILAWHVLAVETGRRFLAPIPAIGTELWTVITGPRLFKDILPSLQRAGLGFMIGAGAGVLFGVLIGYYRFLEPWVRPQIEFMRSVPKPAILPIALIVFGPGSPMQIAVIAVGCFEPALLNSIDGARRIDPLYIETAKANHSGPGRILRRVVLPAAMPQIVAGLRIAVAMALIMMVLSEMIAATNGLGYLILSSQRTFQVAEMYAGVVVLGLVGWIFNIAFVSAEKNLLYWHRERRSSET